MNGGIIIAEQPKIKKPLWFPIPLHPCCMVIAQPMDRLGKRKFDRECDTIIPLLGGIEAKFMEVLFAPSFENEWTSYNDNYTFYLNRCREEVKWLNRTNKFKFVMPVETYFADEFKPTEK